MADLDRDALLTRLQQLLGQRPGPRPRLVLLFGSRARGQAAASSDVDLAVSAPDVDLAGMGADLSVALGLEVEIVDLDEDPGVPLLEALVRDGLPVVESPPGTFATFRSRALATLETDRPWFARMREAWLERVAERGVL